MADCTGAWALGTGVGLLIGVLLGFVFGVVSEDAFDLFNNKNRHKRRTKR